MGDNSENKQAGKDQGPFSELFQLSAIRNFLEFCPGRRLEIAVSVLQLLVQTRSTVGPRRTGIIQAQETGATGTPTLGCQHDRTAAAPATAR